MAYSAKVSGASVDLGLSYINAIGESDTIEGALGSATSMAGDNPSGIGVSAMVQTGPFTGIFEYITATDDFDSGDVAFNGTNAQPAAYQLKLDILPHYLKKSCSAATYQMSEESQAWALLKSSMAWLQPSATCLGLLLASSICTKKTIQALTVVQAWMDITRQ